MKVIFIKDLKKTAKTGDIKDVKDGYAENFLIKNGYAVPYNDKNIKTINEENNKKALEDQAKRKEAKEFKDKLEKEVLVFKVKTGSDDRVFGSISAKQIKEELLKKGYKIDKKEIIINSAIQSLGYHNVDIVIYKDIKATIKLQLQK